MKIINHLSIIALFVLTHSQGHSKVSAEQANQLGQQLTPMGAIMAADPAGIPVWQDVAHIDSNEQPILIITHDNHHQHLAHLTAGQVALFNTYPESFQMQVFPSHRTFQAPQWVYENTKQNASQASLNESQTGLVNALAGIPFPIPQSAAEIYFNHITRWRGQQLISFADDANINEAGKHQITSRESLIRYDHYLKEKANPNRLFSVISKITAPATQSGGGGLVLEPLDQMQEPRTAWLWDKGRRRVIRAPNVSYDQPVNSANALRTADDTDMINGSPERFDWQMMPSRLIYIPYNNDRLKDRSLSYDELLHAGHLNPAHTRYELHRVWVISATIKPEWRHLYSRRDFYIDEDSWSVAIADQYDKQGQLFRVSLSYLHQNPDMPGTFPVVNAYHDLNAKKYHVMGLNNESPKVNSYDSQLAKDNMFTPNGLKRYVK